MLGIGWLTKWNLEMVDCLILIAIVILIAILFDFIILIVDGLSNGPD